MSGDEQEIRGSSETDEQLRAEAGHLLDSGLRSILVEYDQVHVVGSYALRLMTWRDLDIHIVQDAMEPNTFFEMGGRVADLLKPHRMHYRDETVVGTPGLPRGLYWGVYLGDERDGAWKIDIWMSDAAAFESPRAFGDAIAARMTEPARRAILQIKAACWRHPLSTGADSRAATSTAPPAITASPTSTASGDT